MVSLTLKTASLLNAADVKNLVGQRLTSQNYSSVITDSCTVIVGGEIKACLVKGALNLSTYERLLPDYVKALNKDGDLSNRGNVVGAGSMITRVRCDGSLSTRNLVPKAILDAHGGKGNNFGYFRGEDDPRTGAATFALSRFTLTNVGLYQASFPLFYAVGAVMKQHLPAQHASQLANVKNIPEHLRLEGLPNTNFTLNLTNRTRAHFDKNNVVGAIGAMVTLGTSKGGLTIFPRLGLAFDCQPGDVLFADFAVSSMATARSSGNG